MLGRREPQVLGNLFTRGEVDARGRAPGLAHGAVATDQAERPERSHPLVIRSVDFQELAAPDGAIVAVARAVPRNPQRGTVLGVLGQARHDMGVMMLHGHPGQTLLLGVPGREVVGMGVVHDLCRLHAEQAGEIGHILLVACTYGGRVQVADVLPQEELSPSRESNRRLQMPARGQAQGAQTVERSAPGPGRGRSVSAPVCRR